MSFFVIAKRDFKSFFNTPIGWIAACIILVAVGLVFYIVTYNLLANQGQSMDPVSDILGPLWSFFNYISIFIIPAFTMKVMSEELSNGTFRLQYGAPISTWSIVLGKFFGVLFYFSLIGFFLLMYPIYTVIFSKPDIKVILCGWLGLVLQAGAVTSFALFVSSLTKNPVLSYLGSAIFLLILIFTTFIPNAPEWYRVSFNLLDLSHDFTKGIVKTSSISTFIGFTTIFLILCHFVIDFKKWKV